MEFERLVSACGALAMVGLAILVGRHRRSVRLRTVVCGIALQWGLGVFLLRAPQGRAGLDAAADGVSAVLEQSYVGSAFVFGGLGAPGGGDTGLGVIFAFQVLPAIIFVASLFAVLYHLGVMQRLVQALAWVMMRTMGTSGAESLMVAASIFMGQTEAPLTIRPYLEKLTQSELLMVMVAGMASVSGAILSAYVTIGQVPITYLLTAVAMTAPASIVMAKLVMPEREQPQTAGRVAVEVDTRDANVLEAAASGAGEGLRLAANVGAMLIAFIALVSFVNVLLAWLPAGAEPLTLQRILGWLFMPFALLMGVPMHEAGEVGSVLGTRTVLNELVAFEVLREVGSALSDRSRAIATVAICGFANISSIGILIGGLGALVPSRKTDVARLGLLALIAATLANFSSACVTGALLR